METFCLSTNESANTRHASLSMTLVPPTIKSSIRPGNGVFTQYFEWRQAYSHNRSHSIKMKPLNSKEECSSMEFSDACAMRVVDTVFMIYPKILVQKTLSSSYLYNIGTFEGSSCSFDTIFHSHFRSTDWNNIIFGMEWMNETILCSFAVPSCVYNYCTSTLD